MQVESCVNGSLDLLGVDDLLGHHCRRGKAAFDKKVDTDFSLSGVRRTGSKSLTHEICITIGSF